MIYSLSEKLTAWFVKKDLLRQDDFEVYVYCIDSLLTKLFYYIVILAVSICLHMVPQSCYIILGFQCFAILLADIMRNLIYLVLY